MSRRKKAKVAHSSNHHYAPLAMSPVVSFDKQFTPQFPSFQSPVTRTTGGANTSPLYVPIRTSSHSNLYPPRSVSPLSSPSVSLQSAPLLSPGPATGRKRPIDLLHDPHLLRDDDWADVDALVAAAQATHATRLLQQHVDEVPATPTPPNPSPRTVAPSPRLLPHFAPVTPSAQRSLSYLTADPSPPPARNASVARPLPSPVHAPFPSAAAVEADDYPTLSQLLDEEEEERREMVEEEDFASLDELLHRSDDEDTAVVRRPARHTQQSTQSTQPTQLLSPRRSELGDERESSEVDETAATQVLQQRLFADESQSQSQRPVEDEAEGAVGGVNASLSCGVSERHSSPAASVESDIGTPARPRSMHTGRIVLSHPSSLSPTPS